MLGGINSAHDVFGGKGIEVVTRVFNEQEGTCDLAAHKAAENNRAYTTRGCSERRDRARAGCVKECSADAKHCPTCWRPTPIQRICKLEHRTDADFICEQ